MKNENCCKEVKINGLVLLKITPLAYHSYRNVTKGNKSLSYETCRKKLTRNILLAKKGETVIKDNGNIYYIYYYGNLKIVVSVDTVIYVGQMESSMSYVNKKRYDELNRRLKISKRANR